MIVSDLVSQEGDDISIRFPALFGYLHLFELQQPEQGPFVEVFGVVRAQGMVPFLLVKLLDAALLWLLGVLEHFQPFQEPV